MERLAIFYKTLIKALATLEEILSNKFIFEKDESLAKAIRDSKIQRFKYCVDLLWKFTGRYLQIFHGVVINTPKPIFRELFKIGLISEKETQKLLDMVDARNKTSHIYLEKIAEKLSNEVKDYYKLMRKIISRLYKKIQK